MKINQENVEVLMSSSKEESTFTIQTTPHAFKILSDSLYSDKILAVVREYTANAFDAHKASQVDKPIEINLPVGFEEYWSIRDYGEGLSEQEVQDYYISYFASQKNQDNEAIGGFGLGCKAGFAYSSAFHLTSYHKGYMTKYLLVNSDGIPKAIKQHSEPSDELSGIYIVIPVKNEDFAKFIEAQIKVLEFFPKDTYKTNINLKIKDFKYYSDNLIISDESTWQSTKKIIMGNIAYPLSNKFLRDFHNKINEFTTKLLNNSNKKSYLNLGFLPYQLIVILPIGSVPLLPSREGIEENEKILDFILKPILEAIEDNFNIAVSLIEKFLESEEESNFATLHSYFENNFFDIDISILKPIIAKLSEQMLNVDKDRGYFILSYSRNITYYQNNGTLSVSDNSSSSGNHFRNLFTKRANNKNNFNKVVILGNSKFTGKKLVRSVLGNSDKDITLIHLASGMYKEILSIYNKLGYTTYTDYKELLKEEFNYTVETVKLKKKAVSKPRKEVEHNLYYYNVHKKDFEYKLISTREFNQYIKGKEIISTNHKDFLNRFYTEEEDKKYLVIHDAKTSGRLLINKTIYTIKKFFTSLVFKKIKPGVLPHLYIVLENIERYYGSNYPVESLEEFLNIYDKLMDTNLSNLNLTKNILREFFNLYLKDGIELDNEIDKIIEEQVFKEVFDESNIDLIKGWMLANGTLNYGSQRNSKYFGLYVASFYSFCKHNSLSAPFKK